jgi:dynein heavy chain
MQKNTRDMFGKQLFQPPVPITEGLDPLSLLTDDAQIAVWNNEGLPSDRMSTENATILSNSDRWPLMIDPQVRYCCLLGV